MQLRRQTRTRRGMISSGITSVAALRAVFWLALLWLSLWPASGQTDKQAWVQRYNGPGVSDDAARKLVVDAAGNVIMVGFSDADFTGADMLVIKYSGAGVGLWTNRYNGPGNGDDVANAVALDGSG